MSDYIVHPKIKNNSIQTRVYQQILFAEAIKKNTLIILPTGLGKTVVMVMVIAHYLNKYDGIIIVTAPTRPLVDQHYSTFKNMLDILEDEIVILSGSVSPTKRVSIWKNAKVIIATPQTLRNDIVSKLVDLNSVSLLCFDEVHRAVGDDPYVLSAEQYRINNQNGRIIGFTASPKNTEKLKEIVKNIGANNIKYMSEDDPRIKRYIHGSDKELIWLSLPEKMQAIISVLNSFVKQHLKILKELNLVNTIQASKISKTDLIKLPGILNKSRDNIGDSSFYSGMSSYGQLMLALQALEMIETQGIVTLNSFFNSKKEDYRKNNKSSLKRFLNDPHIKKTMIGVENLIKDGIIHPKMIKLKHIIKKYLSKNIDTRILIFANYKATVNYIVDSISDIENVSAHMFVGQASSSYGKGLSQKEQHNVMKKFKDGVYNILVSTSVGEEGLDVAQCDLVVFYDVTASSTRLIQRSGRTGRARKGKVVILITKGTRDEGYFYSSQRKKNSIEVSINKVIKDLSSQSNEKFDSKSEKDEKKYGLDKFFEPINDTSQSEKSQSPKDFSLHFNKGVEKPTIFIDYREKGSTLLRELLKLNIELKQADLPIADFIVSSRVGIERKTVSDFCKSVIDGRLFSQLKELQRTFTKPVLILEGISQEGCLLRKTAFNGALSSVILDFGVPVIRTKDFAETIDIIHTMAKREQIHKDRKATIRSKSNSETIQEEQISLISSLPNINGILADKLLQQFQTPKQFFAAHPDTLKKVHGIGKNISEHIDLILSTPYSEDL